MKRVAYSGSLTLTLVSMVAAAILVFPTVAQSQNPEWMYFTPENSGLPGFGVTALAVDAQGNVWSGNEAFATGEGELSWI